MTLVLGGGVIHSILITKDFEQIIMYLFAICDMLIKVYWFFSYFMFYYKKCVDIQNVYSNCTVHWNVQVLYLADFSDWVLIDMPCWF